MRKIKKQLHANFYVAELSVVKKNRRNKVSSNEGCTRRLLVTAGHLTAPLLTLTPYFRPLFLGNRGH